MTDPRRDSLNLDKVLAAQSSCKDSFCMPHPEKLESQDSKGGDFDEEAPDHVSVLFMNKQLQKFLQFTSPNCEQQDYMEQKTVMPYYFRT